LRPVQAAACAAACLAFTCRLIFRARADSFSSRAFSRKASRPPLKSTVRSAALVTRSEKAWPSASECRVTGDSAGRKRRLVFTLEWLTLWPIIGPTPVSSQRRDIRQTFRRNDERAGTRAPAREAAI